MDYEKAYKEALERARELKKTCDNQAVIGWCEYIFPKLKESEDERIRKELLDVFKQLDKDTTICGRNYDYAKWIAWLEKQGTVMRWHDVSERPKEQREILCEWRGSDDVVWHDVAFYHADTKTFWNGEQQIEDVVKWIYVSEMLEKQGERKPVDKVEPIKVGDWTILNPEMRKPNDKPSWSEEDENIKEDIILNLQENYRNKYINERTCLDEIHWLKAIKERIKGE